MENLFNNTDVINVILKWKKQILILTGAAIVLATIFSSPLFIKPKYKSTAIVYPSNLQSYGTETPTEQMLQLYESTDIRFQVISLFNLAEHYKIDSTKEGFKYYLLKEFDDNVDISKTDYEAVKIDVYDTDPKVACDIANQMVELFNKNIRLIHRSKSQEVAILYGNQLARTSKEVDSLNLSLKDVKVKYGILDYKTQAKEISKAYYRSLGTNNIQKMNELTTSIRNLEEKGNDFITLEQRMLSSLGVYDKFKFDYTLALREVNREITYTNLVVRPFVADRKSFPIRWLIVLIAAASTFLLSFIVVSIIESRQRA